MIASYCSSARHILIDCIPNVGLMIKVSSIFGWITMKHRLWMWKEFHCERKCASGSYRHFTGNVFFTRRKHVHLPLNGPISIAFFSIEKLSSAVARVDAQHQGGQFYLLPMITHKNKSLFISHSCFQLLKKSTKYFRCYLIERPLFLYRLFFLSSSLRSANA